MGTTVYFRSNVHLDFARFSLINKQTNQVVYSNELTQIQLPFEAQFLMNISNMNQNMELHVKVEKKGEDLTYQDELSIGGEKIKQLERLVFFVDDVNLKFLNL